MNPVHKYTHRLSVYLVEDFCELSNSKLSTTSKMSSVESNALALLNSCILNVYLFFPNKDIFFFFFSPFFGSVCDLYFRLTQIRRFVSLLDIFFSPKLEICVLNNSIIIDFYDQETIE